jgi:hypothetical protein
MSIESPTPGKKEVAARQTAETREATPEQIKEVLPELKLTELQKSEAPINKVKDRQLKIETARLWNNYTIVILEDFDEILIFDEDTQKIQDFKKPLSGKKMSIDWRSDNAQSRVKKRYIVRDECAHYPEYCCAISELPLDLRGFAQRSLEKVGEDYFELAGWRFGPEVTVGSDVIISPENKYIVVTSKEGSYFAYLTENENGITLAPRNWERIDPSEPIPPELSEYAERILGQRERFKGLNDKYSALVDNFGINIVENDKIKGAPLFSDRVHPIEENVAVDPSNPNVIYYCSSSNPRGVEKLDLTAEPNTWGVVSARFPQKYEGVHNLQLDPTGNFFLFSSKEDLVVVTKDGLEEVKRVPKLAQVNFDGQGRIRAIDKDGYLVVYEPNFGELAQELDKRRIARLAAGIKVADIFDLKAVRKEEAKKRDESLEYLQPLRTQYGEQFKDVLVKITTQEGVQQVRSGFNKLRDDLGQQGLKLNEIAFIIEGLEALILEKEKELAVESAQETLTRVQTILGSGLSVTSIFEARGAIDAVKATEALLESDLRQEFRQIAQELEQKAAELFRQRSGEIIKDVYGLVERTKADLEAFTSKAQMDDWLEFRYPQLKSWLGSWARDCPLEADEAYKSITGARNQLQELATSFEEKFKREYAKVREKAAERMEAVVDALETDIEGLTNRLLLKGFTDRGAAEQYLNSSNAKRTLEAEIMALADNNPDIAKELDRALKVRLSNALAEIERGGMTQVAETGQQMILFGKTLFPRWEAKVKEKVDRKVELRFGKKGRDYKGEKPDEIYDDIFIDITTPTGKIENVRLYQGREDENDWRLGLLAYRGEAIPPSYVAAAEYKTIKKEYTDWSKGKQSQIQKELQEKRNALKEIYSRRQKIGERTPEVDDAWKQEYQEKLNEYAAFVANHHIMVMKRIDQIKSQPYIEINNGEGYVPKWRDHWVLSSDREGYLESMAKKLERQLKAQQGILNLQGHAGTGKDVLVKMFCNLTNRPYFVFDCSKWVTEFELSEDVQLAIEEGRELPSAKTIPSRVARAIQTPGAVLYFNEWNTMPLPAQVFLHPLLDEARRLTSKINPEKTYIAENDVLFISAENPDYPETFNPQYATKSRRVNLWIDYPPLTRKPKAGDPNPNLCYDASEALQIARSVDSLSKYTYEANPERNEFIQIWDKYVNGIENGAASPNPEERFDIEVILTLVQFANRLREDFIKIFEKRREAKNALPVTQPFTGRELLQCALILSDESEITVVEKATANPEEFARNLIRETFLTHLRKEDQEKIDTAMKTWTSKKRVKA